MKLKRATLVFLLILFTFIVVLVCGFMGMRSLVASTGITPRMVTQLFRQSIMDLNPIDNRVNILVMGLAGGNHNGPSLTDTMMVLSFKDNGQQLSIISIPRDIWSEELKDKINSAYYYGQLELAKTILSDTVGLPIHYGIVFDFKGFVDVVNLVGGIYVNVPKEFTDPEYPVAGKEDDGCISCRYEALHFDAGNQYMDGETALKYVRSRHAEGDEGTDFARGRRQQDVIVALKEKLTSTDVILDFSLYKKIFGVLDSSTDTDLKVNEMLLLGKVFVGIHSQLIKRIVLEDQVYAPAQFVYGRYVLLPKTSWEDIHRYIKEELESKP